MNLLSQNTKPVWLYARVLCAVHQSGGISQAAQRLDVTPSAISNVLAKLRLEYNDALFVRVRGQMLATPKAEHLIKRLGPLVEQLETAFNETDTFDAATSKRHFHIASPDYFDPQFLPALISNIAQQAPHSSVTISPALRSVDSSKALEDGHLDLLIANWPDEASSLRRQRLGDDNVVCLLRKDHPALKKSFDIAAYLAAKHIAPTAMGPSKDGIIDLQLSALGYKREISTFVPYFAMIPDILKNSDLILTTSRGFCERILTQPQNQKKLSVIACPFSLQKMRFYQVWHNRQQNDAGHSWLRNSVRNTVQGLITKP